MKHLVKRVPIVGPLVARTARDAWAAVTFRRGRRLLAQATHPHGPRIAQVLDALHAPPTHVGSELLRAIEQERAALLARREPLDDGSLGPAGSHDVGIGIDAACRVSKTPTAARLMYLLARELRPMRSLELGTNVGISSAYQAAALAANGNGGRIVTLEASPYRLRLARELHARLGLCNVDYRQGFFADTLDAALAEFGPFDFVFIDGDHQYQPTLDYFDRVWRHTLDDALFVFDDIRWSEGMQRAWAALQKDERVALAVDLDSVGICVTRREAVGRVRNVLPPVRWVLHERT